MHSAHAPVLIMPDCPNKHLPGKGIGWRMVCRGSALVTELAMSVEVKTLSPREAWELMERSPRTVLIDVRSSMEFLFVGHPKGSVHVPWIDAPDWTTNPHFVTEVRKVMLGGIGMGEAGGDAPVVLICRSGKRSLEAGKLLIKNGFSEVYNISEGFEG
jgi:rhodanese-related sulfurtransferase